MVAVLFPAHYPQLYTTEMERLGDLLTKIRSFPPEMTMCRMSTSNVSCGNGEIVSDIIFTIWRHCLPNSPTIDQKYTVLQIVIECC